LSDGTYTLPRLPPGSYGVRVQAGTAWRATLKDATTDESRDSDLDPADATARFDLAPGEDRADVDGGLYRPGSVGDFAWVDENGNGVQDSGEKGLAGVAVTLLDKSGAAVDLTETAADGGYKFAGLAPGTYAVEFGLPSGYRRTARNVGSAKTDSDA